MPNSNSARNTKRISSIKIKGGGLGGLVFTITLKKGPQLRNTVACKQVPNSYGMVRYLLYGNCLEESVLRLHNRWKTVGDITVPKSDTFYWESMNSSNVNLDFK